MEVIYRILGENEDAPNEPIMLVEVIDAQATPANTEYPWADGERVVAAVDHNFSHVDLSTLPGGRLYLRVVGAALDEYEAGT